MERGHSSCHDCVRNPCSLDRHLLFLLRSVDVSNTGNDKCVWLSGNNLQTRMGSKTRQRKRNFPIYARGTFGGLEKFSYITAIVVHTAKLTVCCQTSRHTSSLSFFVPLYIPSFFRHLLSFLFVHYFSVFMLPVLPFSFQLTRRVSVSLKLHVFVFSQSLSLILPSLC